MFRILHIFLNDSLGWSVRTTLLFVLFQIICITYKYKIIETMLLEINNNSYEFGLNFFQLPSISVFNKQFQNNKSVSLQKLQAQGGIYQLNVWHSIGHALRKNICSYSVYVVLVPSRRWIRHFILFEVQFVFISLFDLDL